jgi:hypothetical protein
MAASIWKVKRKQALSNAHGMKGAALIPCALFSLEQWLYFESPSDFSAAGAIAGILLF